ARSAVAQRVARPRARRHLRRLDAAEVQVHGVAGVDVALERLHPVARALIDGDRAAGEHGRLEPRQRWWRLAWAEISPHESAALDARIRARTDLVLERAAGGLDRHVEAASTHVELPAVVHAAQSLRLVASIKEARAAVRTAVLDQSDGARRDAERDEALAEQAHAQRRAVGLRQLARQRRRNPVLPHQGAHRGAGSDPTEQLVVVSTQHGRLRSRPFARADGTLAATRGKGALP